MRSTTDLLNSIRSWKNEIDEFEESTVSKINQSGHGLLKKRVIFFDSIEQLFSFVILIWKIIENTEYSFELSMTLSV